MLHQDSINIRKESRNNIISQRRRDVIDSEKLQIQEKKIYQFSDLQQALNNPNTNLLDLCIIILQFLNDDDNSHRAVDIVLKNDHQMMRLLQSRNNYSNKVLCKMSNCTFDQGEVLFEKFQLQLYLTQMMKNKEFPSDVILGIADFSSQSKDVRDFFIQNGINEYCIFYLSMNQYHKQIAYLYQSLFRTVFDVLPKEPYLQIFQYLISTQVDYQSDLMWGIHQFYAQYTMREDINTNDKQELAQVLLYTPGFLQIMQNGLKSSDYLLIISALRLLQKFFQFCNIELIPVFGQDIKQLLTICKSHDVQMAKMESLRLLIYIVKRYQYCPLISECFDDLKVIFNASVKLQQYAAELFNKLDLNSLTEQQRRELFQLVLGTIESPQLDIERIRSVFGIILKLMDFENEYYEWPLNFIHAQQNHQSNEVGIDFNEI
ncbi:hypothetical protein pb186bvf_016893 [Paramecium bursaria]